MVELDRKADFGRQLIAGIAFTFVIGVISMLVIPVVGDFVRPALIEASTLTGADLALYERQVDRTFFYMQLAPFILLFVVVVYYYLNVVRKERSDEFIV